MDLGGIKGHVADVDGGAVFSGELRRLLLRGGVPSLLLLSSARSLRECPGQAQSRGRLGVDLAHMDSEGGNLLARDSRGSPDGTARGAESGTTNGIPIARERELPC